MNEGKDLELFSKELLGNWQNILQYNTLKYQKPSEILPQKLTKIPFLPIDISLEMYSHLWSQFADLFMNPHGAGLEIIFTLDKGVKKAFLHKVDQSGCYIEIIPIITSNLPGIFNPVENLEKQFDRAREWVKSKYNQELGNLRFIPENLVQQFLNIFAANSVKNGINILPLIAEYLDALDEHLELGDLVCYPPSPFLSFIRGFKKMIFGFNWKELTLQLGKLLPEIKLTISLSDQGKYCTYQIITHRNLIQILWIPINITPFASLEVIKFRRSFLKLLIKKQRCQQNLLIELPILKEFSHDLIESQFPLDSGRIKYLTQRLLNHYRNRGRSWELMPSPLLYHSAIRFCLYSLGFRINPYKVSYWSIPEFIELRMNQRIGFNPRICIILGESFKDLRPDNPIHEVCGIILEIENQTVKSITRLPLEQLLFEKISVSHENSNPHLKQSKKDMIQQELISQMQETWYKMIREHGYVNLLVWVQSGTLRQGIQHIIQGFFGRNGIAIVRIIQDLYAITNPEKILLIPQNTNQISNKKGLSISTLKNITLILTDLREY